jgi:ribosome modulation factor
LGFGNVAMAQNVSGGDPYQQGYAAGASAKERNTLNAFDSGYHAGQTAPSTVGSPSASAEAYDKGYAAGLAQANRQRDLAYNEGYQARLRQDRDMADRAFEDGFDAGAYRRSRTDLEFP